MDGPDEFDDFDEVDAPDSDTSTRSDRETGAEVGRTGPTTAYAVNWKVVLLVDGAMGAVVALAGLVALVVWNFALGVFLTGLGLFYVAMVVRRGRIWQQLRQQAGL